jgi:hypothetical protein
MPPQEGVRQFGLHLQLGVVYRQQLPALQAVRMKPHPRRRCGTLISGSFG